MTTIEQTESQTSWHSQSAADAARALDVDPQVYSGFAFGLGIDRMCALMYELDDIRLLFENDVRFLGKFE